MTYTKTLVSARVMVCDKTSLRTISGKSLTKSKTLLVMSVELAFIHNLLPRKHFFLSWSKLSRFFSVNCYRFHGLAP